MAERRFGKAVTQDRNLHRAPWVCSPTGRDDSLRNCALGVRISPDLPIVRVAKQVKAAASKAVYVRVRILPRTPISRALSSEAERLFYMQRVGISKFSARTNHGPFVQ